MGDRTETPEQMRQWLQAELRELWPLALGSLSLRKSPCVRERCAACEAGQQHRSYVLYGKVAGRRVSVYVPEELAPEVEAAIANGRRLQELLQEAGQRYTKALKRQRDRARD